MSKTSGSPAGGPSSEPAARNRLRGAWRAGLYFCFAVTVLAMLGYARLRTIEDETAVKQSQDRMLAFRGLVQPVRKRLASEYTDQDDNLLADAPADRSKWLDPDTLVLAHYQDADADTQVVDWQALEPRLASATGKKVIAQEYLNTAEDVAAIKAGRIHIVALHAADTPYVVNNAGFVPVAVLGSEDGAHGNHLDVAIRAEADIKSLADIRKHTLTCTTPDSITGYRAAIAVLAAETGMRPDFDYNIHFSLGQKRSILGLAGGDFEVAALSDDKLQSMLKQGTVKPSDYRVIYESEVIPRLTIGHVYNLAPELAAGITSTLLQFANEGSPPDESTGKPLRFLASDYRKDFDFVRRIDDSFDPRFHKRSKSSTAASDENPPQD